MKPGGKANVKSNSEPRHARELRESIERLKRAQMDVDIAKARLMSLNTDLAELEILIHAAEAAGTYPPHGIDEKFEEPERFDGME